MVNVILGLALIFVVSYLVIKPNIVEWNQRGFETFSDSWSKIFLLSGAGGILIGIFSWWKSDYNPLVGLIIGLLAGFFGIAAWTDSIVRKVPSEISGLATLSAFAFFVVVLFTNAPIQVISTSFLPRIAPQDFWSFLGISAAVMLLGVLGFIKIKSSIGWAFIFIGFIGFFLSVYALISWLKFGTFDSYWYNIGDKLLITWMFIGIVMMFDLFFGHLIGGADMKAMYAVGWAFGWWLDSYSLFVIMLIGFSIQGIIHIFGKHIGIGELRTIKNGPFKQLYVNFKNRKMDKELIPKTHQALALPFIPVLVTSFIGGALFLI
jgi:hypothetical protein